MLEHIKITSSADIKLIHEITIEQNISKTVAYTRIYTLANAFPVKFGIT